MKKILLAVFAMLVACSPVVVFAQKVTPPLIKPGKVVSGAELQAVPVEVMKAEMKTRSLEDKIQEPKWLTNLPMDSIIYTTKMVDAEDGTITWYSTLLRTDLVEKFMGNKVTTIKTYLPGGAKTAYFWIIDANDGEVLWESDIYEQYPENSFVDVPCDYEIKELRNLQVGYTLEWNDCAEYYLAVVPCFRDMTWLISSTDPDYKEDYVYDYSTYLMYTQGKSTYFGLPFYCVTEGDAGLKHNGIEISGITTSRVLMGENAGFKANFVNYGCMPIQKLAFESRLGNHSTTVEHNMPVPYLGTGSFPMEISTDEAAERREVSVKLKSVNGEEPTEVIEARGSIIAVDPEKNVERNVVMEEFTGDWCGWCPRGMVAIDLLTEEYGEKFIAVGVHNGDKMQDSSFDCLLNFVGGFPSSVLNRLIVADPYLGSSGKSFGIDMDLQRIFTIPTEATVTIDRAELSSDKKHFSVTASAHFTISCEEMPYAMTYVITEDGVPGVQANYFAGNTSYKSDPNLSFLVNENSYWKTTYNHVGRRMYDGLGIEGSLTGTITPGEPKTHSIELELPNNVSNPDNLHLVAMLIDKASGEIVNASSVKLSAATGVESVQANDNFATVSTQAGCVVVTAENAKMSVYAVDGRLVGELNVKGSAAMHLNSGNYVVRVENGNDVMVRKIAL